MTVLLEAHRKRLTIMLVLVAICAIVAIGALVADFRYSAPWGIPAFLGAILVGIGSQIWFMLGFRKGVS